MVETSGDRTIEEDTEEMQMDIIEEIIEEDIEEEGGSEEATLEDEMTTITKTEIEMIWMTARAKAKSEHTASQIEQEEETIDEEDEAAVSDQELRTEITTEVELRREVATGQELQVSPNSNLISWIRSMGIQKIIQRFFVLI